jgi:hypothetical protein
MIKWNFFLPEFTVYIHVNADHSGRASKAWTVFASSNTGIVHSNPTWGMDVGVLLFCV